MPESAFPKSRKPIVSEPVSSSDERPAPVYAELHCLTNYSFLQAASHPDELVQRAYDLNYAALAITDRHSLAGVVRAHAAAKSLGMKLLIGAEVTIDGCMPVVLLAMNRQGYGRLSRLLTVGKRRAPKGECHLTFDDVTQFSQGLLACIVLGQDQIESRVSELHRWRALFGDRCYALAALHHGPNDAWLLQQYLQLTERTQIPLVACNSALYHVPQRRYLYDVLTATRLGVTVADLGEHQLSNGERYLKGTDELSSLFSSHQDCLKRTLQIADRCQFNLNELKYEYPEEICPDGLDPYSWLVQSVRQGEKLRYPKGVPLKVKVAIQKELELIKELNYEAYFLTVADLVKFARERKILCQGRGSAANSAVCYCLGVTSVDPAEIELLFERFISKERGEVPDIDVDFEHERREEVLQYLYQKYGRERAAMTAEVITYRTKSAMRDVGKALGLSLDRVDTLAKAIEHTRDEDRGIEARMREVQFDPTSRLAKQLLHLVRELLGFPRHLSQHVGGMVMTRGRLDELVPLENAAMADRTVLEWDKDDLDVLGILKVDCLALGMLTAIRKSFDLIEQHLGNRLQLATIPADDKEVYDMLSRAESIGVFQVESRAQMSMLPRLRPATFYDLVVEVAIVRPGPIQGKMVHPYLGRRHTPYDINQDPEYPNEEVRDVLRRTLGVPIFQEQAMKLVIVAAGFTPGEADQFRRAMGSWGRRGVMEKFREKLRAGMLAKGCSEDFADRLYKQIQGFGEYGFPESHAASFALLVYASAWLKCYHPGFFTAGLLNSQPLGFYAPAQLVAEARRQGVEVRPVDINVSDWDCTLEERSDSKERLECNEHHDEATSPAFKNSISRFALRLGFRQIRGLSQHVAETIMRVREAGTFTSQLSFAQRTGIRRQDLALLAKADVFRSLKKTRRTAIWDGLPARESSPLYDHQEDREADPHLPRMTPSQEVVDDYRTIGMSLRGHPLQFIRDELEKRRIVRTADLLNVEKDRRYRVAGLVLLRQRPSTAKGITFMTIEDETGTANLVVHVAVWQRFRRIARQSTALIVHGILQRQGTITHLVVDRMEDLTQTLSAYRNVSRDFR